MGNHWTSVDFLNQIILEIFFFSPQSCSIPVTPSPWDWCLIDCTINLILWDKPPCILPPMSNKGWTAIYHWIWPITPPFMAVPVAAAVCALQLVWDYSGAGSPPPHCLPPPRPPDRLHLLRAWGWHGRRLVERFLDRPALAHRAGHLCYKTPPSLWSGTRLSQPGPAKLLWIALLCYLVSPTGSPGPAATATSSPYLKPLICTAAKCFFLFFF